MLRPLSPEQEKILGKAAVVLYHHLRTRRGRSSVATGFVVSLDELAFDVDLTYSTTRRALARLRECGAVRTKRAYQLTGRQAEQRYHVYGKILRNKICLPVAKLSWFAGRRKHGRPIKDARSWCQNETKKLNDTKTLQNKDARSISYNYETLDYLSSFPSGKRDALRADLGSFPKREQSSLMSPQEIQHLLSRGTIDEHEATLLAARPDDPSKPPLTFEDGSVDFMALSTWRDPGVQRVLSHRKAHPRPTRVGPPPKLPALCRPHKVKLGYDEIEPDASRGPVLVRRVLEGYEEASSAIHGSRRAWFKGKQVKDLVTHAKLLKAARVLRDLGIAPGAWAHWRLDFARQKGLRVLGPSQVFSAAKIEELAEVFHDTYDGPQGVKLVGSRDHEEQLCRHQEAIALWENKSRRPLVGMPKWYAEIRKKEITRGIADPLVCYMKV